MTRPTLQLMHSVTTTPQTSSEHFYVEAGRDFDLSGYSKAFQVDRDAFDPANIQAVVDASANLKQGEWLRITHELALGK